VTSVKILLAFPIDYLYVVFTRQPSHVWASLLVVQTVKGMLLWHLISHSMAEYVVHPIWPNAAVRNLNK
jgi:hypothetical protein